MAFVRTGEDRVEWWIAKRLDSPNEHRGGHWRTRHRETKAWERMLASALGAPIAVQGWSLIVGEHRTPTGKRRPTYRQERRRLEIEIHVPSRRNFIRDDDNLAFSRKPITDALKRLGLLCDDSRAWLDAPLPAQRVSDDGKCWTVVRLSTVGLDTKAA